MNADEAVQRGYGFCQSHGYNCQVKDVDRAGPLWRVNYAASNPTVHGRLHLEFDARSRALVRADEPVAPPPPPPPPAIRPMNSDEATRRGFDYCRSRGYECQLVDVDFFQNAIWRLNFRARRPDVQGPLHLEFDAMTRGLVKVVEPRPAPPPRPPMPMNNDEAVRRGLEFCRSRGYQCQLRDADLSGNGIWRLNYDVTGNSHGRVHLEFEALSRALLEVKEDIRPNGW